MSPDRDQTLYPWNCSQACICSHTRYRLRYALGIVSSVLKGRNTSKNELNMKWSSYWDQSMSIKPHLSSTICFKWQLLLYHIANFNQHHRNVIPGWPSTKIVKLNFDPSKSMASRGGGVFCKQGFLNLPWNWWPEFKIIWKTFYKISPTKFDPPKSMPPRVCGKFPLSIYIRNLKHLLWNQW